MNYISLFSGAGCSDYGIEQAGMTCLAQVEIDKQANAVRRRHWPGVRHSEDIRRFDATEFRGVDVVCGGSPCQGFSVAGKRQGLRDDRSDLFWEFARVCREAEPEWFVLENVPGLLSANQGEDIATILEEFWKQRYVVDMDVLNLLDLGIPQRRRRVFIVGQKATAILGSTTSTSLLTMAQCLSEISRLTLDALSRRSEIAPLCSESPSGSVDGLQKRMLLFGLTPEHSPAEKSLIALGEDCQSYPHELVNWACHDGANRIAGNTTATLFSDTPEGLQVPAPLYSSIAHSWPTLLADLLHLATSCITSTETRPTTRSEIYTCLTVPLLIAGHICRSNGSSQSLSAAASSTLTALTECTNYARQPSIQSDRGVSALLPWADLIGHAESAMQALRHLGNGCCGEILFEPESLRRHPAEGREAGQNDTFDVAGCLGGGSGARGWPNKLDDAGAFIPEVARALIGTGNDCDPDVTTYIAGTLSANTGGMTRPAGNATGALGADPGMKQQTYLAEPVAFCNTAGDIALGLSEDGGRTAPPITSRHGDPGCVVEPVAFDWQKGNDVANPRPSTMNVTHDSPSLGSTRTPAVMEPVAFDIQTGILEPVASAEGNVSCPLRVGGNSHADYENTIRQGWRVRRLTPTECERLTGLPDGFTRYTFDGKEVADGPRYRMLGNAWAAPQAEWIARRIMEFGR